MGRGACTKGGGERGDVTCWSVRGGILGGLYEPCAGWAGVACVSSDRPRSRRISRSWQRLPPLPLPPLMNPQVHTAPLCTRGGLLVSPLPSEEWRGCPTPPF